MFAIRAWQIRHLISSPSNGRKGTTRMFCSALLHSVDPAPDAAASVLPGPAPAAAELFCSAACTAAASSPAAGSSSWFSISKRSKRYIIFISSAARPCERVNACTWKPLMNESVGKWTVMYMTKGGCFRGFYHRSGRRPRETAGRRHGTRVVASDSGRTGANSTPGPVDLSHTVRPATVHTSPSYDARPAPASPGIEGPGCARLLGPIGRTCAAGAARG